MNVLTAEPKIMHHGRYPSRSGVHAVRVFAALFAASAALAVIGSATGIELFALCGGYGVIFLGIGAAPFQLRADLSVYARLTAATLVGFSVLLITGGLMADVSGLWDPTAAAAILGLAAAGLHAAGLYRTRDWAGRQRFWTELEGLWSELDPPWIEPARASLESARQWSGGALPWSDEQRRRIEREHRRRRREQLRAERPRTRTASQHPRATYSELLTDLQRARTWLEHDPARASLLITLAGTVLWLAPALWTRDPDPGFWGLLKTIGPLWYLGLVLVLAGFAIGRRHELCGAAAVLSIGLATTLTPALVYGAPREQTAGKQMLLTQYVLTHHHIHVTGGIYQAFSTTFSGVAGLSELLGIHSMLGGMSLWGLATYWPVLLVVMRVAELRFLSGRLLATTGRRWGAVMLVLLVDSLGADYFSPQAIGYVMAVGIVAIAVKGVTPRPFGARTTLALLTLSGIALAPTHELSPYMATGALLILAMFGQAPLWACLPVGLPALAWAAVVHGAIAQNFSFAALFNLTNFRPPVTVATPGLHRLAVVGVQSHLLLIALLLLILLGAIGLLANVRARWAWAYALCPIVGVGFIAINPYGNEGIFRATLFAIPWMAILAMKLPAPRSVPWLRSPMVRSAAIFTGLAIFLGTFVVAAYAMDGTNVLPRSNVAVDDYLMRLPHRDAYVLSVGSADNPADGVPFALNYSTLEWSQVASVAALRQLHPSTIDPVALADRYGLVASNQGASASSPLYLIWARSSLMYSDAYGLQAPQQMAAWLRLLEGSSIWRLVDHNGGTYLFRLT